jgi:hypothetical protein
MWFFFWINLIMSNLHNCFIGWCMLQDMILLQNLFKKTLHNKGSCSVLCEILQKNCEKKSIINIISSIGHSYAGLAAQYINAIYNTTLSQVE